MIEGVVNSRHQPIITLTVQGPSGRTSQIEAVVDSGFTDFLLLPSPLVSELELPFVLRLEVTLADGSKSNLDVHDVSVLWDGQIRRVQAYVSDAIPLVGMLMLEGYDLNVEVKVGGRVVIQASE